MDQIKYTLKFDKAEISSTPVLMEICFSPSTPVDFILSANIEYGRYHANQGIFKTSFSTACYGYDLFEFTKELARFDSEYAGECKFTNSLQDFELKFSLLNKSKGVVAVELKYSHLMPSDKCRFCDYVFKGFLTDQSYIRGYIREIDEFLRESGVITGRDAVREYETKRRQNK